MQLKLLIDFWSSKELTFFDHEWSFFVDRFSLFNASLIRDLSAKLLNVLNPLMFKPSLILYMHNNVEYL